MGCRAVTELETQKDLFEFPYFAEKGKTNFLAVQTPFAFRHHLLALLGKVTTAGDGPVGSIQQFLSFQAKRLNHRALLLRLQAGAQSVSQPPTPTDRAEAGDGKTIYPLPESS
jgi:hypothetical protein